MDRHRFPAYAETNWNFVESCRDQIRSGELVPFLLGAKDVRRILGESFPGVADSFDDEDVRQALRIAVMHGGLMRRSAPRSIKAAIAQVIRERG